MKNYLKLSGLILCSAIVLAVSSGRVFARITAPAASDADIFCVGPSGAEICVDSSGNLLPTTDNDTTLGTTALRFATVNALDIVAGDDVTVADDLTVVGDLFHTPIATQTVTAAGTIDLTGACNGVVRLTALVDATTGTTDSVTHPSSAATGCVYTLVNVNITTNTITLDDNTLLQLPNSANYTLGINDSITIVQVGSNYVTISTSDN